MFQKGSLKSIIIVFFAIIFTGVSFYFLQEGLRSSEMTIKKMVVAMNEVESMAMKAEIKVIMENFSLSVFSDMVSRYGNENTSMGEFYVELLAEDNIYSLEGELITLNEKAYLKVFSLPEIAYMYLPAFGVSVDSIINVWLELDMQSGELDEENRLLQEKVLRILDEENVYTAIGKGSDNGLEHYLITFDKKALIRSAEKIFDLFEGLDIPFDEEVRDMEGLSETLDMMDDLKMDLWINGGDGLLNRLIFENTIYAKEGDISFFIDLQLSRFNEKFDIIAPEGSVRLEELISPLVLPGVVEND